MPTSNRQRFSDFEIAAILFTFMPQLWLIWTAVKSASLFLPIANKGSESFWPRGHFVSVSIGMRL
jgi:hypothetical protein